MRHKNIPTFCFVWCAEVPYEFCPARAWGHGPLLSVRPFSRSEETCWAPLISRSDTRTCAHSPCIRQYFQHLLRRDVLSSFEGSFLGIICKQRQRKIIHFVKPTVCTTYIWWYVHFNTHIILWSSLNLQEGFRKPFKPEKNLKRIKITKYFYL